MKRSALERFLTDHGCKLARHGAGHDVWMSARGVATVPRHKDIATGTALAICKQLGVPKPPFR